MGRREVACSATRWSITLAVVAVLLLAFLPAPAAAACQGPAAPDLTVAGAPAPAGVAWEAQKAPAGLRPDCDYLVGVWGITSSNVFAVTSCGDLIRYDGSQWVSEGPIPMHSPDGVEPYLRDIWGTSSDLFVLGSVNWHEHCVFRRSGGRWTQETIDGHDGSYSGIWGSSSRDIFAVGGCDIGIVNHYDGASWSPDFDPAFSTGYLCDVWGSSGSDVFAVGWGESWDPYTDYWKYYGSILHYDGATWRAMAAPADAAGLNAVWGNSGSDVFAVGEWGTILHYDGIAWGRMASGSTSSLNAVWGSSGSDVFAVGEGGTILHYDGIAWSPWDSGTTKALKAVWGNAAAGFFAVGEGGTILYYYDMPERPVNISPANGAAGVSLTPILEASPYYDADDDPHVASRWQVRASSGSYDNPVWDSGSIIPPATTIAVPPGRLSGGTVYFWRVGYQQAGGRWSSYSRETSFTTAASVRPRQPVNISPAGAAIDVNLTPTLKSSPFADPDGDSHTASQWQVTATAGSYAGALFDSDTDPVDLTQITLPPGTLSSSATYHWRVRHLDSSNAWSEWSTETSFTTLAGATVPPAVLTAGASNVRPDSARLNGELLSLGTASEVRVSFQWGTAPLSYTQTTAPRVRDSAGAFFFDVEGLAAGTTIYYRARAVGDGTVFGSELSLATGAAHPSAPTVATGDADDMAAGSARLNGDLTSMGTARSVTVSFLWGFVRGGPYPNETAPAIRGEAGPFSVSLSGLASGVTFYYQARAVGDGTSYGVEKSFTIPGREPAIAALAADSGRPGDRLTVSITGLNLEGATGVDFGAGISVSGFTVVGDGEITARIAIDEGAGPGARDVTVTTPRGTATARGAFRVDGAGAGVHLWVYLVAGLGGLVGLGILTSLAIWIVRRRPRASAGAG